MIIKRINRRATSVPLTPSSWVPVERITMAGVESHDASTVEIQMFGVVADEMQSI